MAGEVRYPTLQIAAISSIAAGAIHGACAGVHAEHPALARLFVAAAAAQILVGVVALLRPGQAVGAALAVANGAPVAAWLVTRLRGVPWVSGLEVREAPAFADTACAALGAVAAGAALAALLIGRRPLPSPRPALYSVAVLGMAVPAMVIGGSTVHSHDAAAHTHDTTVTGSTSPTHDITVTGSTAHTHPSAPVGTEPAPSSANWPRPWDPARPLDLSGVPGVTPLQQERAATLVAASMMALPRWSTTEAAIADGYRSIGDASTGSEHYIKTPLINDDVMLDPRQPESLVYTVNGDQRTLAGAMFIASARPSDDPTLTDFAGPLMTWHNHGNLCWGQVDGRLTVVGVVGEDGTCASGVNAGAQFPMVHVWITPHPCGVFAALEGIGAGQAAVSDAQRTDMCHDHHHASAAPSSAGTPSSASTPSETTPASATPKPYDPAMPIDLSGTPGVTPAQQAAAENLIAVTVVRLPRWADYRTAEAAGFTSIGDAATGVEHYIKWDWINDDVALDPDQPESLVYQPQADGSKKLVSAMYMLPDTVTLDQVPELGGALTQWHIHDNLCFTADPAQPRVAGLTDADGNCAAPLQKFRPAPMIHVWIVPHPCGPFAALEGIGAGQIKPGEERLCDHVHGSGGLLG
ncbi:MAG: hypothetical protein V9E89_02705 [Ilumatobacteraceae bacterium]